MGKKKQRRRNKWKDLWWMIPSGCLLLVSVCVIFIMEFVVLREPVQIAATPAPQVTVVPAQEAVYMEDNEVQPVEIVTPEPEISLPEVTPIAEVVPEVQLVLTAVPTAVPEAQPIVTAAPTAVLTVAPTEVITASPVPEVVYSEDDTVYQQILKKNEINGKLAASVNNSAWIENGVVHIFGDNQFVQCKTDEWPKVSMVRLGNEHAVGLTEDGKLVYAGSNRQGQQNINTDGIAVRCIDASAFASYAVLMDGTVRASGVSTVSQMDLANEKYVVGIAAEDTHVVLLRGDGSVKAFGNNENGACNVDAWRDITMVDCGYGFTIALDAYGRVHMCGSFGYGQDALNGLENIVAVAAGSNTCFAIDANGVVHAAGSNSKGQTSVERWTDTASIAGGYRHTIAKSRTGEHLGIGDNSCGQLNSAF